MVTCKVNNCLEPNYSLGHCVKHYNQVYKHGHIQETTYTKPIEITCKKCKKKWEFGVLYLQSKVFSQLYKDTYTKGRGKHFFVCTKCQELKKTKQV